MCCFAAEPEVPDVPKEQQLRERFECLEALTAAAHAVLGEARNYTGFQQQVLQLPVDEAALKAAEVRSVSVTGVHFTRSSGRRWVFAVMWPVLQACVASRLRVLLKEGVRSTAKRA